MGAWTEYYVDPSIAADSGAGTIGDPYGDLQYALNQITRDTTNGDRINIKAGTDEILAATISLSSYGTTSTLEAPLVIQGYTSTAGDGGQGGIDCNDYPFLSGTIGGFVLRDLHIHSQTAGTCISLNGGNFYGSCIVDCHFENIWGYVLQFNHSSYDHDGISILGCHIEDCCSGFVYWAYWNLGAYGCVVMGNHIDNFSETNGYDDPLYGMYGLSLTMMNIWNMDSGYGSYATAFLPYATVFCHNSIMHRSSNASGLSMGDNTYRGVGGVYNNIIEGLSGTSKTAFTAPSTLHSGVYAGNQVYNVNTVESFPNEPPTWEPLSTVTTTSSPFTNAATEDFTPTTEAKAAGWPTANWPGLSVRSYVDVGAIQRDSDDPFTWKPKDSVINFALPFGRIWPQPPS